MSETQETYKVAVLRASLKHELENVDELNTLCRAQTRKLCEQAEELRHWKQTCAALVQSTDAVDFYRALAAVRRLVDAQGQ